MGANFGMFSKKIVKDEMKHFKDGDITFRKDNKSSINWSCFYSRYSNPANISVQV